MPPPQGTPNPIEGPGDYTVTKTVHNDTYPAIDPTKHNLTGKAVFISGATRGIGRAISISFAKAGASFIALGARSDLSATETAVKQAAKEAGRPEPKVLQLKLDVSDAASVKAAIEQLGQTFSRLDIVINNAGIISMQPLADSDPDEWWKVYEVNVKGPYLIARATLPLLLKSENGLKQILTVSSVGAHLTTPTISAYQSSKLAVLRVTEFIATEYSSQGITAITVHPGNIMNDIVGNPDDLPPELRVVFTETNELPADTIVWLMAEKREWLNGRYVNCTWDMPQLLEKRERIVEGEKLKVKLDVDF